jgi:hypothetical protein
MLPRVITNIELDGFCHLVSDKTNNVSAIESYLKLYPIKNYNERNSEGMAAVECAARSGSVGSLQYLISDCKADISADDKKISLLEWTLPRKNKTARDYLLSSDSNRWREFGDETSDFLAHVAAGRISDVEQILKADPDRICDSNLRHQNAFYWASKIENETMQELLKTHAHSYLQQQKKKSDWARMGKYYFCMGHFNFHQYQDPQIALAAFEECINYLSNVIPKNHRNDLDKLKIMQVIALQYCARACDRMALESNAKTIAPALQISLQYYTQAIQLLQNTPCLHLYSHLKEDLLMAAAEVLYKLVDHYFALGEQMRCMELYQIALDAGFNKCQVYSQQIITLLAARDQPPANQKYLQKFWDLIDMATGTAKACQTYLGVENEVESTPVETDAIPIPQRVKDSYLEYRPLTLSRISVFYGEGGKLPFTAREAVVDETINVGMSYSASHG